jgi:hypothetical protein
MNEGLHFATGTEQYIQRHFGLVQMVDLLRSLQRPLPHLNFGPWTRSKAPRRNEYGDITHFKKYPNEVRVRIRIGPGVGITSRVGTLAGVSVPMLDREALRSLAEFVGTLVESLGVISRGAAMQRRSTEIQPENFDIGSLAVGRYLRSACHLPMDPTPILLHLRVLSQQTYEGQRIAYGLILTRRRGGMGVFPGDVTLNKRYRAVSDGERTALRLDRQGKVLGLVSLPRTEDTAMRSFRPYQFDGLALGSAREALGIGLSEKGDIVCLQKGSMTVSLQQGHWQVWNHQENVSVLRRAVYRVLGHQKGRYVDKVARQIYSTALDLSFQRRGALFVITRGTQNLPSLIEPVQHPNNEGRALSDLGLDLTIRRNRNILKHSRAVIFDLAMLDGAVIVGTDGKLLAYGAIIKSGESQDTTRGARYQACLAASQHGVALMVSADGAISIVAKGKKLLYL